MSGDPIRCRLMLSHEDFVMANHRVHGVSVMPGVTFLDVLFRALSARGVDVTRAQVTDILFTEPVATTEDTDRELRLTIEDGRILAESRPFRAGAPAGPWKQNMTARLSSGEPIAPAADVTRWKDAATSSRDLAELYEQARQENIVHGAPMRCQGRIYLGDFGLLAEMRLDPSAESTEQQFHLHPAKLDAATLIAFARTPLLAAPYIPISLASVRAPRPLHGVCYVHVPDGETHAQSGDLMHNSYRIYDADGRMLAEFGRLSCKRIRFPGLITTLAEPTTMPVDPPAARSEPARTPVAAQDATGQYREHLRAMVGRALGVAPDAVVTGTGFYELGLDSVAMLRISADLEPVTGAALYPTLLFEFSDIDSLAAHLAESFGAPAGKVVATGASAAGPAAPAAAAETSLFHQEWLPAPALGTATGLRLAVLADGDEVAGALRAAQCQVTPTIHDGMDGCVLVVSAETEDTESAYERYWALACQILQRRPVEPVALVFVSVGTSGAAVPEHAAVAALARTVSAETPILRCSAISVLDALPAAQLAKIIASEVAAAGRETEIRYRTGLREAPRYRPLVSAPAAGRLKRYGVYLITGGNGGLARILARHLAREHQARLILTGRGPEDPALLRELHAAGAIADYVQADITDAQATRDVVEQAVLRFGRLNGVFHLAGITDDGIYVTKDPARMAAVRAPKLLGTRNLDLATEDEPLDLFVLFSSLSAVVANPGQSDYAYANAFLDHFAAARNTTPGRSGSTHSISWPYWADGGMRIPAGRANDDTGLVPLPTADGLTALAGILAHPAAHTVVAHGDPARVAQLLPAPDEPAVPDQQVPAERAVPAQPSWPTGDIAIIGVAGRYPQAHDLDEFWQNLADGRDSITEVPAARWDHQAIFNPDQGAAGKTYSRWGGFLDGVDQFAPGFFGISRREAQRMDPQERLFLHTSWQALEEAGYLPETLAGERVGVFAGVMWNHYQLLAADDGVAPTALHSSIANRVSYCLDLTGPSLAIDTACSSSLVAVHLAGASIRSGESTMAVAGGVNVTVHQQKYLQLADDRFLSADGRCRAFGAGGTGYVPGEGVGAVLLKPLDRALADGDHIHAVIRATAVNHNGRTSGYTVPDPAAQGRVIHEALDAAGVPVESITYVEAHGTGTSLGDPIEIAGLRKAFTASGWTGGHTCAIGSVKSNIGHLESAAGIAGLTKVLLQLRHRELVPSLHAAELNAHLDLESSPFSVQKHRQPWQPTGGAPLRAGVSAFGAGGANAHLILESPPPAPVAGSDGRPQLVILSAPDTGRLRQLAGSVGRRLTRSVGADLRARAAELAGVDVAEVDPRTAFTDLGFGAYELSALSSLAGTPCGPEDSIETCAGELDADLALADIAYTLQVGRRALDARAAFVAGSVSELRSQLADFAGGGPAGWSGTTDGEPPDEVDGVALFRAGRLGDVAEHWVAGAAIDWVACHAGSPGARRRVSLPPTPLVEQRYWVGEWKGKPSTTEATGDSAMDMRVLEPGIALVTMADVANRNMFTDELLEFLERTFTEIAARPDIRAVVLTGTEQVFCMGGSPETLAALAAGEGTFTQAAFVYEGLLRCAKPVVAAMRGNAAGGGFAFGLYADVVVMSRAGGYSANFLKYGFTPGMGASYILEHRFGAALATEMQLTGRAYRGDELERRGGQLMFEDADNVLPAALNAARSMTALPANAVYALKRELAGRILDRLPGVIASEVAMHTEVLGDGALRQVQGRFPTPTQPGEGADDTDAAPPAAAVPAAAAAAAPERPAVTEAIQRILCAQLYAEPHELDFRRTFSDLGLDSIGAVETVKELNAAFGTDLDSVAVYDHPTARQLADAVLAVRAEQAALHRAGSSRPATPAAAAPATSPAIPAETTGPAVPAETDGPSVPAETDGPSVPAETNGHDKVRSLTVSLTPLPKSVPPDRARPPANPPLTDDSRAAGSPGEPRPDTRRTVTEIAVVGMAGRFPDAADLDEFWRNLAAGRESIREIPADRFDCEAVFDPDANADGKTYSRWAAMLSDVDQFDNRLFNMSPLEAQEMDPQQRIFLMEAWKALEDAGYAGTAGERQRCGVFVGCAPGDYTQLLKDAGRAETGHTFLGNSASILAARIAYFLDLRGPTAAVDTACSSSLVAVHLACESLRSGDSDLALAGGVALMLTPSLHVRSSRVGMLSPTGTSAPFGAAADGIVLGEGAGVVVLKRLTDAMRDGDHIHGVIKASGVNGDGRTNGITAPSASSQASLLREVHARAQIGPPDITFVEAHGTGTALGDPIEFKALSQVWGEATATGLSCGLGSVKANVGHTTMAAGIAGLLKVLLALRHRQVPPTPGFADVNPKINIDGSPFAIVAELREWRPGASGIRIGSVSSFGFSGTNCHLVVAEPPHPSTGTGPGLRRAELIPVSARSAADLDAHLRRLADGIPAQACLSDVAYTLATGRRHQSERAAVVARSSAELRTKLAALAEGQLPAGCSRGPAGPAQPAGDALPMHGAPNLDDLGAAYVAGADLDWASRFSGERVRRLSLPGTIMNTRRHWVDQPPSQETPAAPVEPPGRLVDPGDPFIADHRVGGRAILAGAASAEFVVAEAELRGWSLPVRLSKLRWLRPLAVDRPQPVDVSLAESGTGDTLTYRIGDRQQPHGTGLIERLAGPAPQPVDIAAEISRCPDTVDIGDLYASFTAAGLAYGPAYRLLHRVVTGDNHAVASITAPPPGGATVPAAVLDAAFQASAALIDLADPTPLVPVGVQAVEVHAPLDPVAYAVVRRRGKYQFDIMLTGPAGQVLLTVNGLSLRPADRLDGMLHVTRWQPAPEAVPERPRRVVVLCQPAVQPVATALLRTLNADEAVVVPFEHPDDLGAAVVGHHDAVYLLAAQDTPAAAAPGVPEKALLRIIQGLPAGEPVKLVVAILSSAEAVFPAAAGLVGLARAAAAEHPGWRVGCVTVDEPLPPHEAAQAIAAEDGTLPLVAVRDGRRLVRTFEPVWPSAAPRSPFRPAGTYLLLGGAGGIGFTLSLHLARTVRANLVWIGRRSEDATIRQRMQAVTEAGGQVLYLPADASDEAAMSAAVRTARDRLGPLHGVFHTAGVMRDRTLRNTSEADLDAVLAAKVTGSVNLSTAVAGDALDFLMFFSSAATLINSAGQAGYAAAGAFEDAYAMYLRQTAPFPVSVINWGYWGSVGAVANDYHRGLLAADGIGSIEPADAMAAVERALAANVAQLLVIKATAQGMTHFQPSGAQPPQSPQPPVREPARPSLPAAEPPIGYVKQIFAEILKYDENDLDEHTTFEQYGVDSVIGGSIIDRMERDLGRLPSTLLFEEMTIGRLAARLARDHGTAVASAAPPRAVVGEQPAAPPRAAVSEPPQQPHAGDVAVVGVAGRYPGSPDIAAFWANLKSGFNGISEVPASRWNWRDLADPRKGLQEYQRWGGFLDGVDLFDAGLFGILPSDAADIDPQERLFLETCWRLLEEAGYLGPGSHEPSTGVFAGLMYGTYGELAAQGWPSGRMSGAHSAYWSVANRVSYTFDFAGLSMAVDTACSSSLTAVHLACESIRRGDCRMAIAGGVNLILHPAHFIALGARNMLASDGTAKVFDAAADGYVPGEGVGAVLLKALPDAIADGDDIWAVIKAGAVNAGGKTSGFTVPNPNAQANLVAQAISRAGWDSRTITCVEAHGTGTDLGDPIEVAGLARAFQSEGRCAIGSVKSNIGHLEGAAGIAGLTKVLLQLRHGELAPTVNLTTVSPKIDFAGTPFVPQRTLAAWPRPRLDLGQGSREFPRRAGVSSFGAGGANVHLILEEFAPPAAPPEPNLPAAHLFVLSAPTRDRLQAYAVAVADGLGADGDLAGLAYTSQTGRRPFPERLAVIAASVEELAGALRTFGNAGPGAASVIDGSTGPAHIEEHRRRGDLAELGRAWTARAEVDWTATWPSPRPRRVAFAAMPFVRRRYWLDEPPVADRPGRPAVVLVYERPTWVEQALAPAGYPIRTVRVVGPGPETAVLDEIRRRFTERGVTVLPAGTGTRPDALLHLGAEPLAPDAMPQNGSRLFAEVFDAAVGILSDDPRAVLRVVCGQIGGGSGEPHHEALAGLLKTLAAEHPGVTGVCVAADSSPAADLAARLVAEVCDGPDAEVAHRGGIRLVKRMVAFTPPPAPAGRPVRADGTYLITGGAGALGLHLCSWLVDQGAGEVVLAGRSPLPAHLADRIAAQNTGRTSVRYERADVADLAAVETLVAGITATGRPLRGVIHAAGVIRDAHAVDKTPEQLTTVLTPKVDGTLHLDRATAGLRLDFFVLFSSIVGQAGNRGQSDYAYGNSFLDAFAVTREQWRDTGLRHGRTLSIGWPLWRDGGMTVDDATVNHLRRRWGVRPMETDAGLQAFATLLAGRDPVVHVVQPAETAGEPDARPAAPAGADVTATLARIAADFLLVEVPEVDQQAQLLDMGFDSISMTDLVTRVNETYGLDLLPTVLFECPTLAEFGEYLTTHHAAEVTVTEPPRADSPPPAQALPVSRPAHHDIAIIGMAGILPKSAGLAEFWTHLAAGDDLVGHVPEDREELLADPRTRHLRGGFVGQVAEFDADLFGVAPREAALMDPQQRLFLHTVRDAVADAGYRFDDLAGTRTGLFVGVSTSDYDDLMTLAGVPVEAHTATGISHAVLANRVSHLLDLHGPSEAVDTACSSALVAVHHAVRALRSGECTQALAGGVNVTLTPGLFVAFTESGMLSASGRCATFDAGADGYVRGEGAGAVLLKPLERALADGDHIHAVIKGSAVNHGGRAASLTAPNPRAQAEVLTAAYADASVDVDSVSYVEAHGTGTRLGDPVEIEGLKKVFAAPGSRRRSPLLIGSVKTNIGHLESAAGIAGLLKVVLSMTHRTIPAHLHLSGLNPHIRLDGTRMAISDRTSPWPGDAVRRAGVSSFGFGGTNAHLVLEEAPQRRPVAGTGPLVLTLSAPDRPALNALGARLRRRLSDLADVDLPRIAYTLQTGHEAHDERLAVVCPDLATALAGLSAAARGTAAPGLYRRGTAAPSGRPGEPAAAAITWVNGGVVDWPALWTRPPGRISLPPFPLARTPHWFPFPGLSTPAAAAPAIRPEAPPAMPDPAVPPGAGPAIRQHLAEVLGLPPTAIDDGQSFQKLGLDSVFALDLADRLAESLGREVPATLFYDHDTVRELAIALDGDTPLIVVAESPPAAAEPVPAIPAAPDPRLALSRLLEAVVEQPIDPDRTFEENGYSSFDMLRVVSELELHLGTLPKTLLFDLPDLATLTAYLTETFGAEQVAALTPAPPDPDSGTPQDESLAGWLVVAKSEITAGSPHRELIAELTRDHAVESGLAGRDIAPLLFLGAARRGFLEFSKAGKAALVWSHIGTADDLDGILTEFDEYCAGRQLAMNILSPRRLDRIAGRPCTATPFGVVQQLDDLATFALDGGRMSRLRGSVKRFSRRGRCAVSEYLPGSDRRRDAQLVELIDRWSAGKTMINPYVRSVRRDFERGVLDPAHRVFLTMVDEIPQAVVVMTRMPAENGYLLDVEFYREDMERGGLEYTIVEIIGRLRDEGARVFSFGATFGIKICDSPNTSPAAERELAEMRSAGLVAAGNYGFKNKFRPAEMPIYLCQPDGPATGAADVLLMIASPAAVVPPARPADVPPARRPDVAPAVRADIPAPAAPPSRPASAAGHSRLAALDRATWNTLRLARDEIEIDLVTDSWAERDDDWISGRMGELNSAARAGTQSDVIAQPWLPYDCVVPTTAGRSAEALLCRAWPGKRGVVLHNGLFPTWLFNLADQRFTPVAMVAEDGPDVHFGGDLATSALRSALAAYRGKVSFVVIEIGGNAGGGRPMSLAGLRRLRAETSRYAVPLIVDATRIVDNAVAITRHESGRPTDDPWAVVRELLSLADAATFSLSKDFGTDFGGLVATSLPELADRLRSDIDLRGSEVSLAHRRTLQAALSGTDVTLGGVVRRSAAVHALHDGLAEGGLPVVSPPGVHCVLLDPAQLPQFKGFDHPAESWLAWVYQHLGLRAGPHLSGGGAHPAFEHFVRLAVPVGMTVEQAVTTGARLAALHRDGDAPAELMTIGAAGAPDKAAFAPTPGQPAAAPALSQPAWFSQQLRELGSTLQSSGYQPTDQNLEVVREFVPGIEVKMVSIAEGEVEVLTVGTGPTLVLMHPFNIGAGMFAPQLTDLAGRFRMIVIHQPGVGRTRVNTELSLEGMAELQRRILAELGVRGPVHVGGASVGAIFAQYFALRHPELTRSLSLLGGSYKFANRKGQIDRLEQVIAEDFDAIRAGTAVAEVPGQAAITSLLLRCESMDPRTGLRYLDLFAKEPDLTPRLAEISVPTLVVHGRQDTVVGIKTGHFLHGVIPDARYVELPGSGHFVCFTDPDRVNEELARFLAQVSR